MASDEKFSFTPFKEMKKDLARRAPWYISDWKDGWSGKVLSATFFMMFTSIAPAITFAGVLDQETVDNGVSQLGPVEVRPARRQNASSESLLALRQRRCRSSPAGDPLHVHHRLHLRHFRRAAALHCRRDRPRDDLHDRVLQAGRWDGPPVHLLLHVGADLGGAVPRDPRDQQCLRDDQDGHALLVRDVRHAHRHHRKSRRPLPSRAARLLRRAARSHAREAL